jgi:hypothetical protein
MVTQTQDFDRPRVESNVDWRSTEAEGKFGSSVELVRLCGVRQPVMVIAAPVVALSDCSLRCWCLWQRRRACGEVTDGWVYRSSSGAPKRLSRSAAWSEGEVICIIKR